MVPQCNVVCAHSTVTIVDNHIPTMGLIADDALLGN